MQTRLPHWFVLFALAVPLPVPAGVPKPCIPADQASKLLNKDVCVSAHVYDVVQLPDGTRFLDVCTPQTSDDACRFTIISLWEDRDAVGELRKYRDMDVVVRGIVAAYAWPRWNGAEPRPAVLRRPAQIQAQSEPRSRLQRRPVPPARQRPQPPLPGRRPRLHEYPRSRNPPGEVAVHQLRPALRRSSSSGYKVPRQSTPLRLRVRTIERTRANSSIAVAGAKRMASQGETCVTRRLAA